MIFKFFELRSYEIKKILFFQHLKVTRRQIYLAVFCKIIFQQTFYPNMKFPIE